MSHSGYLHAMEILERLRDDNDAFNTCLLALKHAEDGQRKLASGEFEAALQHSRKAADLFQKVPAARLLLGVCKADIAAAYGNLGRHDEAASFARESILLVSGDRRFAFTEAMANMTLGISLYMLGNSTDGAKHLDEARRILRTIPEGAQYLAVVDQNEQQLKRLTEESMKPMVLDIDKKRIAAFMMRNTVGPGRPSGDFHRFSLLAARAAGIAQRLRQEQLGDAATCANLDLQSVKSSNPAGYIALRLESAHVELAEARNRMGVMALLGGGARSEDIDAYFDALMLLQELYNEGISLLRAGIIGEEHELSELLDAVREELVHVNRIYGKRWWQFWR